MAHIVFGILLRFFYRHVVFAMHYQNFNSKLFVNSRSMREIYRKCYENNVSPINDMEMWLMVDIEDMLSSQYKKGLDRSKKLTFWEHDETGSRLRRPGVAYRCTQNSPRESPASYNMIQHRIQFSHLH